jgi:hypothetical protein
MIHAGKAEVFIGQMAKFLDGFIDADFAAFNLF